MFSSPVSGTSVPSLLKWDDCNTRGKQIGFIIAKIVSSIKIFIWDYCSIGRIYSSGALVDNDNGEAEQEGGIVICEVRDHDNGEVERLVFPISYFANNTYGCRLRNIQLVFEDDSDSDD